MKAVFVHDQLEYRLEVDRDVIRQGDQLVCGFSVKNHDTCAKPIADLRLDLASGEIRNVHERKEDAFQIITSAPLAPAPELTGQARADFTWTLKLDRNCPISDKSQTLYLLYGRRAGVTGQHPLAVLPHTSVEGVLRILETSFQFVPKSQKSAKGWVDAKLKPPSSRRFSMLNELVLGFRAEAGELVLRFNFNEKRLKGSSAATTVTKKKTEVERRIGEERCVLPGGLLNQELLEAEINEALKVAAFEL